MRSYPRIGTHDLGIQLDIVGAFLFCQGALGGGLVRGPKIDAMLTDTEKKIHGNFGHQIRPFGGLMTAKLIAGPLRSVWKCPRGPKNAYSMEIGKTLVGGEWDSLWGPPPPSSEYHFSNFFSGESFRNHGFGRSHLQKNHGFCTLSKAKSFRNHGFGRIVF